MLKTIAYPTTLLKLTKLISLMVSLTYIGLYAVSVGLQNYFALQGSMWRKFSIKMLILQFGMLEGKDDTN